MPHIKPILGNGLPNSVSVMSDCPHEGCEGILGLQDDGFGLILACSENPNEHWRLPTIVEENMVKA